LKGENHPLYGKGHSQESKDKISAHHIDISGFKNPNCKLWIILDPNGKRFEIKENKHTFCKRHGIRADLLTKFIGNIIPSNFKSSGWCLLESRKL
jgi:hypothetical protein